MRKKRISLLLVFAMLLSMLPVTAAGAPKSETPEDPADRTYSVTLDTAVEEGDSLTVKLTASRGEETAYALTADTEVSDKVGKVENISVTVYKTDKDTKITLTGDAAKYYDVKVGTNGPLVLEESSGAYTGPIDLASGVTGDNKVTITIAGKEKEKIESKSIGVSETSPAGTYNITLDGTPIEGSTKAYLPSSGVNASETIAGWTQATTEDTVKKALGDAVQTVTCDKGGQTVVVVTYENNRVVKAGSATLPNMDPPASADPTVSITPAEPSVAVNASTTLTAEVDKTVTKYAWALKNETSEYIELTGAVNTDSVSVKGLKEGSDTVTLTVTVGGKEYTAECTVTVTGGNTVDLTLATLTVGGKNVTPLTGKAWSVELDASDEPKEVTIDYTLTDDTEAAYAVLEADGAPLKDPYKVTVQPGVDKVVNITVSANKSSETYTLTITMPKKTTGTPTVELDKEAFDLEMGATGTIKATVKNVTADSYEWTVEGNLVTLSNETTDTVTVKAGNTAGKATVKLTVTYDTDQTLTAECVVTVVDPNAPRINTLSVNEKPADRTATGFEVDLDAESTDEMTVAITYTLANDAGVTVAIDGATQGTDKWTGKVTPNTPKIFHITLTKAGFEPVEYDLTVNAVYQGNDGPFTLTVENAEHIDVTGALEAYNKDDRLEVTLSAKTGYVIKSVAVTMGGQPVDGAWNNGKVTIGKVTGNVVITVTAESTSGEPALTKLTVGDKEFTGDKIKTVMTATLAQSSDKTVNVNIVYEIDSDTTVAMAGSEGVQVKPDGEKKYVATVTPGELAEIAITLTKGGKTKDYTVVINVPKPTGSAAPVLTDKSTKKLIENTDVKDTPVTIESSVSFDKANAEIARNWEITGTNLTLTSVKISGTDNKTATLTFAGTAPYSTMGVKAKAVAFVKGTTEDSNVLEIRIDRDNTAGTYTSVAFTVNGEDGKAFTDGAIITVRSGNMDIDSGKTNSEGKLTLQLALTEGLTYTAVASKSGYTSHSQDFIKGEEVPAFTIKEIEAEVPADLNESALIGGVPSANADQLKLPKNEEEMPENSAPIEAAVTVPNAKEAIVTFDKDQVGAMKNEDVVSSTTVTVGNNSVTLPAEALDKALTDSEIEDTENIKLGVEVKETTRPSIQKPDTDQQITIKKSVSVTVYDVTTPSAPKELKINGLVKQLITIIMDVGNEIDTNPKGSYALIYIDGNTPKKISDNRWAPIGDGKISVSMSHLSEIALVSSTDAAGLDPDVEGGQILIAGKVTDERGAPAVGVTVTLNGATGNPTRTTNANGEYDFHDKGEQPYPDNVAYTLSFAKDGYYEAKGNEPLSLSGGKMYTTLNRRMYDAEVTVLRYSGEVNPETGGPATLPVENATVIVTVDGQMLTFEHKPTDQPGVYSGVKLPAGEHNISAHGKYLNEDGKEITISGATKFILPVKDAEGVIQDSATATATLSEAGAPGEVEIRDSGTSIEVRFNGEADTRYLVQSYTVKEILDEETGDPTGETEELYVFNLYNEVVDTFMEVSEAGQPTVTIYKMLDASSVIEFAGFIPMVTQSQVQGDYGWDNADGVKQNCRIYNVGAGNTNWTKATRVQ